MNGLGAGDFEERAYLFELLSIVNRAAVLVALLDATQQEIDLGDNNLCKRACRTAGAGAGDSTQDSTLRWMGGVVAPCLQRLARDWRESSRLGWRAHGLLQ